MEKRIRPNRFKEIYKWGLYFVIMAFMGVGFIQFGAIVAAVLPLLAAVGIIFIVILPFSREGIYIDDEGLRLVKGRGVTKLKWAELTHARHDITKNYHVISLGKGKEELHIHMEDYPAHEVANGLLQYIPRELLDEDSLMKIQQYKED